MSDQSLDDPFEQAVIGASFDTLPALTDAHAPSRFGPAVYALILLLGALSAMGPLAIDMYLPSFPQIALDLHVSVAAVERTLAAYFVGLSIGQLFYGPAADRFGRKTPLYFGLITFALASMGCALTRSVNALIAFRFLQALGGCAEMVIARAVVRDRFEARDAARVFSSLMLVMGLAPILGPLLGGWLVVHAGWRALFWILTGFGAICLICIFLFLPESLPVQNRHPTSARVVLERYKQLLKDRLFMAHTLAVSLSSAAMFAYIGGSAFVFIQLHHVRPEHFGFFFGSNAFGLIMASQINGRLVRTHDPRSILRTALLVESLFAALLLLTAYTGWGGFPGIVIPLFCIVSSQGFVFPNTTALAMAPHGKIAGNASALLGCLQFSVSGLGGLMVSLFHDGTALPMAGTIVICAAAALAVNVFLAGKINGTIPASESPSDPANLHAH